MTILRISASPACDSCPRHGNSLFLHCGQKHLNEASFVQTVGCAHFGMATPFAKEYSKK